MLAGIDFVFIGAGISTEEAKQIPKLPNRASASLRLDADTTQVDDYVRKGGARGADTEGRSRLCNALMTNIGLPLRTATGRQNFRFTPAVTPS